jgi:hypothetical protein
MSLFVKAYTFCNEISNDIVVSMVRKGLQYDPAFSVGKEKTEEIIFARGSYENYMENITEIKSVDFSYVSQGFLYKPSNFWCFIPLNQIQAGKNFRKALVIFKKPRGFKGGVSFELEGGETPEKIISGYKDTFNECGVLLHQGKILKVTYTAEKSIKTFYLIFDGKKLKTLTWSEVVFGGIRRFLLI